MPQAETVNPPQRITLCLSGGGLRATFFHLGVITALRENGLLGRVKEVFSVSGGSITAAHLALNWSHYDGSSQEFEAAAKELRAIAARDIRGRVLRRWALSWALIVPRLLGLRRIALLQREYEAIFGRKRLRDSADANAGRPELHLLATSFNTGHLCSFTEGHFIIERASGPEQHDADTVRLSVAVAASSAFPPMFPPLKLTREMLGTPEENFPYPVSLTDGGVYDNLGFKKFSLINARRDKAVDAVILSDGSGAFQSFVRNEFAGLISRNVRATDILMRRTAEEIISLAAAVEDFPVVHVSIGDTLPNRPLPIATQRQLQSIRTDLDTFSKLEVDLLVNHGRDLALDRLGRFKTTPPMEVAAAQPVGDLEAIDKTVRRSAIRRIGFVNLRDWATYAVAAVALLYGSIAVFGYREYIAKEITDLTAEKKMAQDRLFNATREIIEIKGGGSTGPAVDASTTVDRKNYVVWVQFAGTLTREQMRDFNARITAKGWNVPGASQGGERTTNAAGLREVRFGPSTGEAAARLLASDIDGIGIVPGPVATKRISIIPNNSLEIWISK